MALFAVAYALFAGLISGCAMAPKSRLDDCAKVAQTLRAENAQLKDSVLSLKGENTDLAQRAVDDGRKIAALEQANERYESSVQAYIDERENLNESFERFRRLAQSSARSTTSAAISPRLRGFAATHPGSAVDPATGTLAIEADRLFLPGTDRLRPEADAWLDELAAILSAPEAKSATLLVAGHAADSPVRLASTDDPGAAAADLSLARGVRVRDALAQRTGRDPARIGVAGMGTARPLDPGDGPKARSRNARIEIEIGAPAVAAGTGEE
jgi:chemotaxis protein MotB